MDTPRDAPASVNPLRVLPLDRLRRRTSVKWRTYPDDVLPLWGAETDVPLAEPVARATTEAVALGDTGYPVGGAEYAAALGEFARKRWEWDGLAVFRPPGCVRAARLRSHVPRPRPGGSPPYAPHPPPGPAR